MPIKEIEDKYSFTKSNDFDFLYLPYENGDSQVLDEEYRKYLRKRFEIQKQKIYQSLRIE